jgi:phenylalanyl-tRNA synthetase beta chain
MKVTLSWLREHVDLPAGLSAAELERALVQVGLEVEEIIDGSATVTGPLVVGRVESVEVLPKLKKPIRYCQVSIGESEPSGIICGAANFDAGDLVVVALPGAVLPGDFAISSRKTYGKMSHGMICSGTELGVSDDHDGIIVLPADCPASPGDDARSLIGLNELTVELSITPDRGYCLSARGIARELSHALGGTFHDPALAVDPVAATPVPAHPVHVTDPVGCDRFAARAVRGVDPNAQSPDWMKQRLTAAGVRCISLPVDITNYLMLDLGQPMHAFDLGALRGDLVVRRAVAGERLTTLDSVERVLDAEDMVICDTGLGDTPGGVPVSLAAVMGGETSEVVAATVDVLFEAAHWDPIMVARTCRRHRLSSEAAKRWERGVDRELCLPALELAVGLLTRYGGGTVDPNVLDFDAPPPESDVSMFVDLPSRTAGVSYSRERVIDLLTEIGCRVAGEDPLHVTPPSWRPDLTDPADLVEEVVRLDGYDKVPSVLPVAPPGSGLTASQRRRRSVGRALAEAGYHEVLCYPFVGSAALDALGLPADDPRRAAVRLRNPLSDTDPLLRTTLLPTLLSTLRRNLGRGTRDVALFEIGRVFHPSAAAGRTPPPLRVDTRPFAGELATAGEVVPVQPWQVAVVGSGAFEPAGWWGNGRSMDWADAVEAGRIVAETSGVDVVVRAAATAPWHPGRCAQLRVAGAVVGHAGELHPAVCAAFELPKRTCAMELTLDALPLPEPATTPGISGYPPALLDVALVVDAAAPAEAVRESLVAGAGELLESVRLFDVYAGAQVGEGRKSLAYKLIFRAPDRTLTVEEAVAARDAAVAAAAAGFGAVLRGA